MLLQLLVEAVNNGWRDANDIISKQTIEAKIVPMLNEKLGVTKKFTASDEVWEGFLRSHPKSQSVRKETFADYEDLMIVFCDGTTKGNNSIGLGNDTDATTYRVEEIEYTTNIEAKHFAIKIEDDDEFLSQVAGAEAEALAYKRRSIRIAAAQNAAVSFNSHANKKLGADNDDGGLYTTALKGSQQALPDTPLCGLSRGKVNVVAAGNNGVSAGDDTCFKEALVGSSSGAMSILRQLLVASQGTGRGTALQVKVQCI
ncbi:hypothetical protein C1H46_043187 [Malus baccata]|uniref:Myb/SANT-like domain-containing protein n=1 Tax=Malus baccata TaxID=106549 RepID=A0A540KAN6_MALBA|nr:hypothetical protein C1H46_043187 [Malus baccata]